MSCFQLLISALLVFLAVPAAAQPFVYVATTSDRQFSFNTKGHLTVLDGKTLDTLGQISLPDGQFAESIALGLNDRRAYIATAPASSGPGTLTVVDTITNTTIVSLPLQGSAGGVALSKDHQRVFVSHRPSFVSVFSTANHALIAQITVGNFPTDLVLAPDGETMYAGQNDGVSAISTSSLSVTSHVTG